MQNLIQSLGPVTAVIGAQWGDEGKGKVIDILAPHFTVVARACGGANAGHTIVVNGKKHVFRLLPSGSLHTDVQVLLGAGMVIHLPTLLEEIQFLEQSGIELCSRLHIASAAHIVFDYHKEIDSVLEERRSRVKGEGIGTTKKGIGPAYMEKAARSGLRLEALQESDVLLRSELAARAVAVSEMYGIEVHEEQEYKNLLGAKKILSKKIVQSAEFLAEARAQHKKILIEGAQATLLDVDHGTYPFGTSSSTTAAGAMQGLGLPPQTLTSVIGVAKAYCTRVGSGAFPTEVEGEIGQRLRDRGGEYGSVTGRPRRCGWLSIPDLNYSAAINGFLCWNITKLDVLDEEDEIPVAIEMKSSKPVYKKFPGWKTSTVGITDFSKLPKHAKAFLTFIEEATKIPIALIGTGQGREEMVVRNA